VKHMAIRRILSDKDTILRKKSRVVETIDERVTTLLDDMVQTLKTADGIGLAAPQVGILKRIAIVDIGEGKIVELINPEIKKAIGQQLSSEGCLSIPGVRGKVKRPKKVVLEAFDRNGVLMQYTGEDIIAVAFCHELDHLEGVLFTDKVTEYEYD